MTLPGCGLLRSRDAGAPWEFGDMPAQPAVTAAEIVAITRYLRELQRANGIH